MSGSTVQAAAVSLPRFGLSTKSVVTSVSTYKPVWPEVSEPDSRFERELELQLERAFVYCVETQDRRGAWQILPDPRPFDCGLVAFALAGIPRSAAQAAVDRARVWLQCKSQQKHSAFARLFDETPGLLLSSRQPVVDLRDPALYSEVFSRKTLLLYALAKHCGAEVLTPFPDATIRDWFRDFYQERAQLHLKQWGRVDLLAM